MAKVAVLTNCWNETFHLPRWIEYYGDQFGREHLYIIDDGSTDGSTFNIDPVNVFRFPKSDFNDRLRRSLIENLCQFMLNIYDAFIYTDADEYICVDPSKHSSLAAYLASSPHRYITAIGLNIIHNVPVESAFDSAKTILSQRRYVEFTGTFCKPLFTRIPLKWTNGFHFCNQPPVFDDLFLFHAKYIDIDRTISRNREILSVRPQSAKHSKSVEQLRELYRQRYQRPVDYSFDFSAEIAAFMSGIKQLPNGIYSRTPLALARNLGYVPNSFVTLF